MAAAATGVAGIGAWIHPSRVRAAASSPSSLIVGSNFDIKTLDPGRELEEGTNNIAHVTYDQLVTFQGEDLKTPRPSLATGWTISDDGRAYTFRLRPGVRFASGNSLTSADVKWSLDRLMNIKGNAAFFLDGVEEIQARDPLTTVIRLRDPRPGILAILSSPVCSVVDSRLVMEHGGEAGPDAKETDKAESFLNSQSAGSGSFILTSYTPNQDIVLTRNPNHWRGAPPLGRVIIRNIKEPATQDLELRRGDLDIALAIGPDQIRTLAHAPGVTVKTSLASNLLYVMMNNNPQIGGPFSNPKVQQAVRYALDYQGLLALAGPGAIRLAGTIPTNFPGALPSSEAVPTDRARARELLKEANLGPLSGVLTYSSDLVFYGVQNSVIAEKVQQDLAAVGIRISLNGLPTALALQQYRDGKNQLGIWAWAAVFPDVSYYLGFVPGRTVAVRAGWPADATPETRQLADLGREAEREVNDAKRAALYLKLNRTIAQIGPWAPMFQPVVPYAFRSNVRGVTFASSWEVDYYAVGKG